MLSRWNPSTATSYRHLETQKLIIKFFFYVVMDITTKKKINQLTEIWFYQRKFSFHIFLGIDECQETYSENIHKVCPHHMFFVFLNSGQLTVKSVLWTNCGLVQLLEASLWITMCSKSDRLIRYLYTWKHWFSSTGLMLLVIKKYRAVYVFRFTRSKLFFWLTVLNFMSKCISAHARQIYCVETVNLN